LLDSATSTARCINANAASVTGKSLVTDPELINNRSALGITTKDFKLSTPYRVNGSDNTIASLDVLAALHAFSGVFVLHSFLLRLSRLLQCSSVAFRKNALSKLCRAIPR